MKIRDKTKRRRNKKLRRHVFNGSTAMAMAITPEEIVNDLVNNPRNYMKKGTELSR